MNTSLVFSVLFVCLSGTVVHCAPLEDYSQVRVLESRNLMNPDGTYEFSYTLDDGESHSAIGTLKEVGGANILVVRGSYAYNTPDGQRFIVNYIADENGYRVDDESFPSVSTTRRPLVSSLNPKSIAAIVG